MTRFTLSTLLLVALVVVVTRGQTLEDTANFGEGFFSAYDTPASCLTAQNLQGLQAELIELQEGRKFPADFSRVLPILTAIYEFMLEKVDEGCLPQTIQNNLRAYFGRAEIEGHETTYARHNRDNNLVFGDDYHSVIAALADDDYITAGNKSEDLLQVLADVRRNVDYYREKFGGEE